MTLTAPSVTLEIAELLDEMIARVKTGNSGNIDAWIAEHPEHANELERLAPAVVLMAQLSQANDQSSSLSDNNSLDGTLGDFRLIREVGRGGMGVVYEAMQISLNRRVALKVLPFAATMDPRHLQRFRNEAQAAACLHHPNIVPVYGVGCDRGVHYYAMQLITGRSLADVVNQLRSPDSLKSDQETASQAKREGDAPAGRESERLANREGDAPAEPARLEPRPPKSAPERNVPTINAQIGTTVKSQRGPVHFRSVAQLIAHAADALEYAHSMGVVHRDIKPGNLLVDEHGHLWVTDFGLAKLETNASMTITGDLLGTLRYMSPEQALAKHGLVDHRTDVYSLGATLYELLTGRPAVVGEDKAEILKHIAFEEPMALRKIDKSVPVELETITLKALAKEPGERYATAKELAEDLRRWGEEKPIKAKPPAILGRIGKWIVLHRVIVAMSVGFILLAAVGLTLAVLQLSNAKQQVQTALDGELRARERVQGNLRLTLTALDEATKNRVGSMIERPLNRTREEIETGRKLRAYYEDFIRANSDDAAFRLEVSKAYLRLGHIDIAEDERSTEAIAATRKGLVLAEELLKEFPDDPKIQHVRATGLAQLSWRNGFNILESEPQLREAIGILERLEQRGEPGIDLELPLIRVQRGQLLHYSGRLADAATQFRHAAAEFETLAHAHPDDARVRALWGISLINLEAMLRRTGQFDEAANAIELAIVQLREAVRRDPRHPIWRLYLRQTLVVLSAYHAGRTRPNLPRIEFDSESVAIMERLVSDYPEFADYRYDLAVDLARLSLHRGEARQFEAALHSRQRSIALFDALVAESPTNDKYRTQRDEGLWWLAVEQRNVNRESDALSTLSQIPESNRRHADAAWTQALIRLTAQDLALRNADEALKLTKWGTAQPIRQGAAHGLAEWQFLLAVAQFKTGATTAAKTTLDSLENLPTDFADMLLYFRAMVHWRLCDKERALDCCRKAIESRRKQPTWALLEAFHADALRELGLTETEVSNGEEKKP